jgi:hypothetical protein
MPHSSRLLPSGIFSIADGIDLMQKVLVRRVWLLPFRMEHASMPTFTI